MFLVSDIKREKYCSFLELRKLSDLNLGVYQTRINAEVSVPGSEVLVHSCLVGEISPENLIPVESPKKVQKSIDYVLAVLVEAQYGYLPELSGVQAYFPLNDDFIQFYNFLNGKFEIREMIR